MGRKIKDISGQKFGRLTALYKLNNYHKKDRLYWLCACECGNLVEVAGDNLRLSKQTSCGCLHKKHNKSNTRIFNIWIGIKQRCYDSKRKNYKYYGARGIKVCDEWQNDFMSFYNWSINNGYKEGLTIDRINVDGNYEPSNCRWLTNKQQQRNKHNNRNITIKGETHCLSEWCEILGLNYSTVKNRVFRGWSIEKALKLEENHA